ncbi:MAG: dihydropteroate synthase [Hyphomicrobium sp.]
MDQRRFYVRPLLALGGEDPEKKRASHGMFAKLCARDDLLFSHVEILERHAPKQTAVHLLDLEELKDFSSREMKVSPEAFQDFQKLIANLTSQRADFAGLSMERPRLMGIVNITPDSFSDGGSFSSPQEAITQALRLAESGADILDLGAESTRPGARAISVEEELKRLMPVLEGLRPRTTAKISIDTRKSEVMLRAAEAGADLWNDVSALTFDPRSLEVAAEKKWPLLLMHAQGLPETMNEKPVYENVALDVFDYLEGRIDACLRAGIESARLVLDPGIGFGKHLPHNVALLSSLSLYHGLGVPVLLGVSRKKLIGQLSKEEHPKERVSGSLAAALAAIAQGVQILRVHDVAETLQAVRVWQAILRGAEEPCAL